jgi:hypothetical protein
VYEVWISRDDFGRIDDDYIVDSTHSGWTAAIHEASRIRRVYSGCCAKVVEVIYDDDGNEARRDI